MKAHRHASLEIRPAYIESLDGLEPGMDIWVLTWLHQADRNVLKTHPRSHLQGVFATRSPDRPNPIGLHRAKILTITDHWKTKGSSLYNTQNWTAVIAMATVDETLLASILRTTRTTSIKRHEVPIRPPCRNRNQCKV
jgi:hypothetical protein